MEKKFKNLVIRLTEEEHKNLKRESLERNITMSKLVKQAITMFMLKYSR